MADGINPLSFNTSSYPTAAAAAAPDALTTIGKVLSIQGAQQQLVNQQMEFKARSAMGPILQQSIDPQSGELNINKFLVNGAANPDLAWKMPEITLQMIQRQNTQADTVLKELKVAQDRYKSLGGVATALQTQAMEAAKGKVGADGQPGKPVLSQGELTSGMSDLVSAGLMDSKDAAEFLAKHSNLNDAQRFQLVSRVATSSRDIDKGLDAIYGAVAPVTNGAGTSLVQSSPRMGTAKTIGQVENLPSPSERNATVEVVQPDGSKKLVPRAEAAPMSGGLGTPAPGTPAAGGVKTALSPIDQKLQETRATAANDYDVQLTEANTAGQENLRVLREMQDALKIFKSGGGQEVRQKFATLAQSVGAPEKLVDEIAGGNRGAIAEFQKLAVRYATQEMKTNMGAGQRFTNLDFGTFLKNNPTIDTDPRGLDKMFKFLEQGVWRAGQQQEALQRWKQGERPKGYENSDISSFPAFWTKLLSKANEKQEAK